MKMKTFIALSIVLVSLGKQNAEAQTATNVFNTTGNAGIGTVTPVSPLQILNNVGGNCTTHALYGSPSALRIDDETFVPNTSPYTSSHNIFEIYHSEQGCSSSLPSTPIFTVSTTDNGPALSFTPFVGINKTTATHTLDVGGTINADADLTIGATATVTGATTLGSTLTVTGTTTLNGAATVNAALSVVGATHATTLGGTLGVTGATTLNGATTVNAALSVVGTTHATTLGGTLGVTGITTLHTTNVLGASTFTAPLSVVGATNATTLGGSLNVTGAAILASTLTVGATSFPYGLPPGYKLYVAQGILTEKLKVANQTDGMNWSDFVFNKDYKLMPLANLENYVTVNKHLPEIPSAKDVAKDGIDVADIDAKLLQKIEELTLYIIQQQKEIDYLKMKIK